MVGLFYFYGVSQLADGIANHYGSKLPDSIRLLSLDQEIQELCVDAIAPLLDLITDK